ncbi:hypothetical protein KY290_029147 [Solanum tuberosum]|uniref:Pollen ole e 1 allergen and extensin family protein n=2 Tax=Solanum tuberosum TaxID=4113 RepID=A0ABQ7UJX6_SOLTU|nr:PREDICTED: uncharacterized protein LOC102600541 [Solanum tuberosum]KAH0660788.1 hypothetical protein KY289_029536 [Solanum tuberosum]KAH0749915.1 hypothetical protein KY290_029147 [Solanum tuberosum]
MASYQLGFALFITLVLATLQFSSCYVLKGSVTCLDCSQHIDLSGIKVSVKCSQVKTLTMATTEEDGFFETKLPFTPTNKCYAKILGGPNQLFISRKETDPNIVKSQEDDNSYTISNPLKFYTKCPSSNKNANGKCNDEFGSSKTIDLPVPKEWGIAPTSYYVPFLPIIGIP